MRIILTGTPTRHGSNELGERIGAPSITSRVYALHE